MKTEQDGGSAFPLPNLAGAEGRTGMTLRDWFAGQALVSMGVSLGADPGHKELYADAAYYYADAAYYYADAMLRRRAKDK